MGCHPKVIASIDARLRDTLAGPGSLWYATAAEQAADVDRHLDDRYDAQHRATEWDAERWGFDPDRWCEAERVEMERQARGPG